MVQLLSIIVCWLHEVTSEGLRSMLIASMAVVDDDLPVSLQRMPPIKEVGKSLPCILEEADADLATSHLYSYGELR